MSTSSQKRGDNRADIHAEISGRELEVLHAIGIDPTPARGSTHRACPFPDHDDANPSWRWDAERRRFFCSCAEKGGTVIDAVMRVERVTFPAAVTRVRALLELNERVRGRGEGNSSPRKPRNRATGGLDLNEYAAAKRLQAGCMAEYGCATVHRAGVPAVRIPYRNRDGREVAVRYRCALEGENRFAWQKGAKVLLYGLWRLPENALEVVLVEGESDCHTLWSHGQNALGLPGAGTWREERDAPQLAPCKTIYVLVEPDRGGEAVEGWLAKSAIKDRARLVSIDGFKDPSALHCDDPERFVERWAQALRSSVAWTDEEARLREQRRKELWAICRPIAELPDILGRFAACLVDLGVVGEVKTCKLIYLAVTSRRLSKPVSAAVKGPSSSGKSYTTERVLDFFPPSAFLKVTSLSDKALIYTEEDLRHRFIVILELSGMESGGLAYLIRTLLSEGFIEHLTVEKVDERQVCRRVRKDGPTGLLVTTTKDALHPENETRLLSLSTTDTQDQTRNILAAMAVERRTSVDLAHWRALQEWLELADGEVAIPFAEDLAARVSPVAVRLRRDFGQILSLIRAHAILHQATRSRDAAGRIFATVEDYDAVRDLVADLVAEGVGMSVKAEVRETVNAVQQLTASSTGPVTYEQVGKHLKLDKSSAMRRCKVGTKLGYLINREERRGQPAQLAIGAQLPDDGSILPAPEALTGCATVNGHATAVQPGETRASAGIEVHGCTVARAGGGYIPGAHPAADGNEIEVRI